VALTPQDGAIRSLVAGFRFIQNKFNSRDQAWRQPGSTFKPFIYSAALEKGYARLPSSTMRRYLIRRVRARITGEPKDDDHGRSNAVARGAAKIDQSGLGSVCSTPSRTYAQQFVTQHFSVSIATRRRCNLPLALGAGQTTPLQLAAAYYVFANGGYTINPY